MQPIKDNDKVLLDIAIRKWKAGAKEFYEPGKTEIFAEYTWQCFKHFTNGTILYGEQLSKAIGFKRENELQAIERYVEMHSKFIDTMLALIDTAEAEKDLEFNTIIRELQQIKPMDGYIDLN